MGAPRPLQTSESQRRTIELFRQEAGMQIRHRGDRRGGGIFREEYLGGRRNRGSRAARHTGRAMRRIRIVVVLMGVIRVAAMIMRRGCACIMMAGGHADARRDRRRPL